MDIGEMLIDNLIKSYIPYIALFIIALFALIFIILFFKHIKFKGSNYKNASGNSFLKTMFNTGDYGEYLTYTELEKLEGYHKLMTNLYISKKDQTTTEIDLIMISETGIYVFESKNYSGWIFGDEKQKNWIQTLENRSNTKFFNPIWQNNGHINALKSVLELGDEDIFKSYIIFSERCILKKINVTSDNVKVLKRNNLIRELKKDISESKSIFDREKIDSIYNELSQYTLADDEVKKDHIDNIKAKHG